jgi:hypothetical protein
MLVIGEGDELLEVAKVHGVDAVAVSCCDMAL